MQVLPHLGFCGHYIALDLFTGLLSKPFLAGGSARNGVGLLTLTKLPATSFVSRCNARDQSSSTDSGGVPGYRCPNLS